MRLTHTFIGVSSIMVLLAGCSSLSLTSPGSTPDASARKPGGYYKDDGPGSNPPADLAGIPDAIPRVEPLHRYANRTYTVLGKTYTPMAGDRDYRARGLASWYGRRFHGKPTASGEIYDMYAMTAAHPTLPIPSYVRVTNPANQRSVVVRVNDRGPFHEGRIIDLSYTAAWKLDLLKGVREVLVERIDPARSLAAASDPSPSTPQAPPARGNYLQLAALGSEEAARNLLQHVRSRQAELQLPGIHRIESGDLIKIHVGPYQPDQLDMARDLLAREFGLAPFRVSY